MENCAVITSREILYLPVDKIRPNPYQPRRYFDRQQLEELSRSIKEYGVMQPISVRLINSCAYELVAGERRLRATQMAGISNIPAIVVNINDKSSAILAMIENLQRQDLNFMEEAEGLHNLLTDYSLTQEELAVKIGKSQSTVANKLRLLKLSKKAQRQLLDHNLTERHARALLSLNDEEKQLQVIERIVEDSLTVKETEELIENLLNGIEIKKPASILKNKVNIKRFVKDIRIFTNTIKQAVDVMNSSGCKADYLVTELDSGCEISIRVVY